MLPDDILKESFAIIDREARPHTYSSREWPIVRRMIHASGDLELVRLVEFRHEAVEAGVRALRAGTSLVTDVTMVAAGINKSLREAFHLDVHCFIGDPDVVQQARERNFTRSRCAMEKALAKYPGAIYIIGNAPTALAAVCEAVVQETARPQLLLAMPVGFVGVRESKDQALALNLPTIVVAGRKGGSALAAAAVNALMVLAGEEVGP